jgi:hypothetical protein
MKHRIVFSVVLSLFLMIGSARPKESQKFRWEGKTETKDGVTIVSNPSRPLFQEDAFRLEEDLSIGETGGGRDYVFGRAWYIAVDDEGLIYVMDQGDKCVKVYEHSGKYLRSIGREGQGPGELQAPNSIHLIGNRHLVFEDFFRGLIFFTKEGRFERFLPTSSFLDVLATPDNRIVARANALKSVQPGKEIRVYDRDLKLLNSFLFLPEAAPRDSPINKPFEAGFHWELYLGNRIALSYKPDYEMEILDLQGISSLIIKRDYDRVGVSRQEIDDFRAKYRGAKTLEFPSRHPAIQEISADDEGRIFAKTFDKTKDGKSSYYDIFDREGRYIVRVPISLTARSLVWKNKKMYCLDEDEEGFQKVKRYRVLWQIPI